MLNVIAVFIVSFIIVIIIEYKHHRPILRKSSAWNSSNYESNSEYYKQLTGTHNFSQLDNLRLDRIWSPRFHPINGKSVIYLRKQYHMPDLKGVSITLHWINLETNRTIQLTRPIWGINDHQVRLFQ